MLGTSAPARRNRHRTGAARREQHLRAQGRAVQHLLAGLDALTMHRGGQLTALGQSLALALRRFPSPASPSAPDPQPPSAQAPTPAAPATQMEAEEDDEVLPQAPPTQAASQGQCLSIYLSQALAGPGHATTIQLPVENGEVVLAVCQRIASAVQMPVEELAFHSWHDGVGPGDRVRDFTATAGHLGLLEASLHVSERRSFVVNRAQRAPRSAWVRYAKEHLSGVLDPTSASTEALERFDELAWP